MQRQTARSAAVRRLARVTHEVHSGWRPRTVPVEDTHESHRLRRRIAAKGEADAAAVLVDLGGGLALADVRSAAYRAQGDSSENRPMEVQCIFGFPVSLHYWSEVSLDGIELQVAW